MMSKLLYKLQFASNVRTLLLDSAGKNSQFYRFVVESVKKKAQFLQCFKILVKIQTCRSCNEFDKMDSLSKKGLSI